MIVFVSVSVNLVRHWNLIFPPLQEGLTALDMARGGGEEAVCKILQQHTKQKTELTEVSQQLHVVSKHTPTHTHSHMHTHTHTHTYTHTIYIVCNIVCIHLCTHSGAKRVNLSEAP